MRGIYKDVQGGLTPSRSALLRAGFLDTRSNLSRGLYLAVLTPISCINTFAPVRDSAYRKAEISPPSL